MPQPLPVHIVLYTEVLNRLNELDQVDPSDMQGLRELRELEAKALEIKKTDLGRAFSALGSIAAAAGNSEKMRVNYRKALQHTQDFSVLRNYAVAMVRCNFFQEASDYAEELYAENRLDIGLLGFLAGVSFELGDEGSFLKYAREYKALTKKDHELYEEYLNEMREIEELSGFCAAATARTLASIEA